MDTTPKADPAMNPNNHTPLGAILDRHLAKAAPTNGHSKRLEDEVFQAHSRITVAAALAAGWAEAEPERRKR